MLLHCFDFIVLLRYLFTKQTLKRLSRLFEITRCVDVFVVFTLYGVLAYYV